GDQAKITPSQVDVTVHGPQRILHDWVLPAGAVFVDAAGLRPGAHQLPGPGDPPAPPGGKAPQPETVRVGGAAEEPARPGWGRGGCSAPTACAGPRTSNR